MHAAKEEGVDVLIAIARRSLCGRFLQHVTTSPNRMQRRHATTECLAPALNGIDDPVMGWDGMGWARVYQPDGGAPPAVMGMHLFRDASTDQRAIIPLMYW